MKENEYKAVIQEFYQTYRPIASEHQLTYDFSANVWHGSTLKIYREIDEKKILIMRFEEKKLPDNEDEIILYQKAIQELKTYQKKYGGKKHDK